MMLRIHTYLHPEVIAAFSDRHLLLYSCTEPVSAKYVQYSFTGEKKELDIDTRSGHFKGCDFRGAFFPPVWIKKSFVIWVQLWIRMVRCPYF